MHPDSAPPQPRKAEHGKTVKGMAMDPTVAGLERGGGIKKETALEMLMRGQRAQLESVGRAASKALFGIVEDPLIEKFDRKNAADILLSVMEGEMPVEEVAMCLLLLGFPREREIAEMRSPRVDAMLKNVLLDGREEQEMRARAAHNLRERGFPGFGNPEYDVPYFFFSGEYAKVPRHGLAAVPFLVERLAEDLSTDNRVMAASLLGEISDLCEEKYDWREAAKGLRSIAESHGERSGQNELRQACAYAFKRITGVYPSQDRNPSTTGPAEED